MKIFLSLSLLLFLLLTSCIDEYWPAITKYENRLVVDGGITDKPGPYTIRLSITSPVDAPTFKPFLNCEVIISEEDGASETLIETEDGVYKTKEDGIQGEAGKKYKLTIKTPDEKVYESNFEKLIAGEKIESVYGEIESRQDENYPYDLEGYQFYVNTETASNDSTYFFWRLEATYHYQSDYTIRWIYDGELNWFHGPDSLYNCYRTYYINNFYLMSTEGLTTPKIEAYALNYVNTETRQLSVKYSLLVKQYTLNRKAFLFWDVLREQNSSPSSLFSRQPYQLNGNVYNVDDPEEPVLGYFLVAGLDEERIFVDRPKHPVDFHYSVCTLSERDFVAYAELIWADPVLYPLYAIETSGGFRAVPPKGCTDCREHGGTITKPDFWED
ncbi:MAG: hypothetical protein C0595_11880 [Marinilabiliales bacterium]|nr:MAG: hypothetical protein C0595_11880 [Marinilabiliales bacterium]